MFNVKDAILLCFALQFASCEREHKLSPTTSVDIPCAPLGHSISRKWAMCKVDYLLHEPFDQTPMIFLFFEKYQTPMLDSQI